jgi:hypothetical protein
MPITPVSFPAGSTLDVVVVGGTLPITLSPAASVMVSGGTIFSKLTYDGLGIPVVVSGGSVALNLNPGDIKIGNVVLEDDTSGLEAQILAANATKSVSNRVLLVQHVDEAGSVFTQATQTAIDTNTANTALLLLDLDETGTRQLNVLTGIQTYAADLPAIRMSGTRTEGLVSTGNTTLSAIQTYTVDLPAIRMSGTRVEGLLGVTNSDLSSVIANTANLLADGEAIRMSGTRVQGLISTGNSALSTIQTNTGNLSTDLNAVRMSGTRSEDWLSRLNALETTIAANTANFAGTVVLRSPDGHPIATYTEPVRNLRHLGVSINQDVVASFVNSTSAALPISGTFLGVGETTLGVAGIQVSIKADQNATVRVEQSPDGSNWDIHDSYSYYWSLGGASWTTQAVNSYYRVHIANAGTGNMSYMRMQTALCPVVEALPRALTADGNLRVCAEEMLPTFGSSVLGTPHQQIQTATVVRLAGATFSGTNPIDSVDTQYWTKTRTGADADVTQFEAQGTLATGVTANGGIILNSNRIARFITGSSLKYRGVIVLPPITGANTRRWGAFDPSDGYFFEHDGAILYCVSRRSGIDSRIPCGSFNGDQGNSWCPVNNAPHTYEIYWTNKSAWFMADGVVIHKFSSSTYPLVGTQNLKVGAQCVNTGANSNLNRLFVRASGIARVGQFQSQSTSAFQSGQIASRVLKYGAGMLRGGHISGVIQNSVATLYDAASVDATKIIWSSGVHVNNQSLMPYDVTFYDLPFSTGLTLAVTAANLNMLVVFE